METKTFHVDVKVDDNDEDEFGPYGGFLAVISDPSVDRDGERVMKGAFDPLPDRIPIDVDHSRRVEDTIGHGIPFYDGDRVMARARFASTERAQLVRQLMKEGHITGVSVMFGNAERGERLPDGSIPIRRAELVKFGVVDVPANPNATLVSVKTSTMAPADIADADVVDLTGPPYSELAQILDVAPIDVADRLTGAQAESLHALAASMGPKAARQAWRAGPDRADKTAGPAVDAGPAEVGAEAAPPAADTTPEPAGTATASDPKTYTLEEAAAELETQRRAKMLEVITDPDVVAAQLGGANAKRTLYASLVNDLAASIALVRIPDGIDYQKASTAAQAAVDALEATDTETPDTAPPPSPTSKVADDPEALAKSRAEVIAQAAKANEMLAQLQGHHR